MRNLVYTGFMSLDGVVDSPGGGLGRTTAAADGWSRTGVRPEAWSLKGEESHRHDGADVRPSQLQAFASHGPARRTTAAYKELPKYVVSTGCLTMPSSAGGADDDPAFDRGRRRAQGEAKAARSSSTGARELLGGCPTRA